MKLIRITAQDQFEKYRDDWSAILETKKNTNPFIEFDWVNEWWKYLGTEQEMEIIAVRKEGKFVAFFPFTRKRRLVFYTYEFMAFGQANYMDFIAHHHILEESIKFVFDEIMKRSKNVVFNLHGLLESGNTPEELENYLQDNNIKFSVHRVVTPYIDLETIKTEEFMKKRQRLHRLDRREKRLNENGKVDILRSAPKEMDYIFQLHDKRWKKKRDTSGFTNPKEKEFFRRLAQIQDGPLRTEIDSLYINDTMIAFNYGFNCRGRFLGYVLGYDDDFETFGPGRILEKQKILDCKYRNDHNFDLSIGYEPYKFEWNTHLDYTRKMIFSSNSRIARVRRSFLTLREKTIERVKENYKVVIFIRNTIGKFLYAFRNVFIDEVGEKKLKFGKVVERIRNYLYENERYVIYKMEKKDVPDVTSSAEFNELTINDAMKNEEISKKYMKEICKKIYGGYKGYYPKGNLSFNNIFWTNEKVMRIERIAYLEQFRKSSIYFKNWTEDNLSDICSSIKRNSKARTVYVAVEDGSKEKITLLESVGFSSFKEIKKRTYLGFEKYHIIE